MCQLQLIGIKTNLESFAITILMEHMLNQHQLPLFLWVSKQWVICSNQKMVYPIPFTEVLAFSKTNEHYYMDENVAFTREVSIQSIGTDSMSCYRYGTKTSVILIGV